MNVVILCAGIGSRLAPLTKDMPKCLVKINGTSIIQRLLNQLERLGISNEEITLCSGYKDNRLPKKIKKIRNIQYRETNMIYTLMNSLLNIDKEFLLNNDTLIIYGDCIYEFVILECLINTANNKTNNLLPIDMNWEKEWAKRYEDYFEDAETLKYNKSNNKLISIGNKTRRKQDYMGQFMGLLLVKKNNIIKFITSYEELSENNKRKISTTEFINTTSSKINYEVIKIKSKWAEIDNLKDLEIAQKRFID